MLSGVGGNTIAEAKENMTMNEFNQWCVYRNQTGPLDSSSKICEYIKQLTFITIKIAGDKKMKIEDLELYRAIEKHDPDKVATTSDILNLFKSINS